MQVTKHASEGGFILALKPRAGSQEIEKEEF